MYATSSVSLDWQYKWHLLFAARRWILRLAWQTEAKWFWNYLKAPWTEKKKNTHQSIVGFFFFEWSKDAQGASSFLLPVKSGIGSRKVKKSQWSWEKLGSLNFDNANRLHEPKTAGVVTKLQNMHILRVFLIFLLCKLLPVYYLLFVLQWLQRPPWILGHINTHQHPVYLITISL